VRESDSSQAGHSSRPGGSSAAFSEKPQRWQTATLPERNSASEQSRQIVTVSPGWNSWVSVDGVLVDVANLAVLEGQFVAHGSMEGWG
jgi:hypothetical protein